MLRMLRDAWAQEWDKEWRVVFENTGREHDKTLDFVRDVEQNWGIPITWLEYTRVAAESIDPLQVPEGRKRTGLQKAAELKQDIHWFKIVNHATAKRIGQHGPFDEFLGWAKVLPNVRTRSCSVQMKIRTRDRYLRALGVGEFNAYIGIRADEAHRKLEILVNVDKYEKPRFPMIDAGITKADVRKFWDAEDFRLGLPQVGGDTIDGNCDACYLKARWKRLLLARAKPKQVQWWADWEKAKEATAITGARFKERESYSGLLYEAMQPTLFNDLDRTEEDVACSCATGGYRGANPTETNHKHPDQDEWEF